MPISGSKFLPNLAVGGQDFPPDNTGCQGRGGLTECRSGGEERRVGVLSFNIMPQYVSAELNYTVCYSMFDVRLSSVW